jgi:hypothetical protein
LLHLLGSLGGRVTEGVPKTEAGARMIFLDAEPVIPVVALQRWAGGTPGTA